MAKIRQVDYDQMINKASQIANAANDMQNSVKDAYKRIQDMSQNWFGQSYDNFVKVANGAIQDFNKIFEVTVSDIPHEIAAKAKSYAKVNQGEVTASLNEQIAIILSEVPLTNKGTVLRWETEGISADQQAIKSKFESAKSAADKASSLASSLESDWQSISGDTNIAELKKSFKKIQDSLDYLANSLDGAIRTQEASVSTTETAINAVKAAKNIVTGAIESTQQAAKDFTTKAQQAADQWEKNMLGKN